MLYRIVFALGCLSVGAALGVWSYRGVAAAPVLNLPQDLQDLQAQVNALGAPPPGVRFVNNGDGTITDFQTGLMWLVMDDSSGLYDKDTPYTWTAGTTAPDGTLFTTFLAGVNSNIHDGATDDATAESFGGGYTDWRVPRIVELQTILDETQGACGGGSGPCVDPIFNTNCTAGCTNTALDPANACSCTAASSTWSSTSFASNPIVAWYVSFFNGFVLTPGKDGVNRARAVRGGR